MPRRDLKYLELTEADLLGYTVDDVKCVQCGGAFCGMRIGRVLSGKPLIMCPRKEPTQKVLAVLGKR